MFYDKYAHICKLRGISMSAAAMEAGLSKSLVTKWKVNKIDVPSPDVLKKLSSYFNIPVSELLEEKENPATEVTGLTENQIKLLAAVEKMTDAQVSAVLAIAEQLSSQQSSRDDS